MNKTVPVSVYHMLLRTAALVVALMLTFDSGVVDPVTASLSQNTQLYLAQAVGMSVSVAPTELNQYTAALGQKERELEAREAVLTEREIEVELAANGARAGISTYILSLVLFILTVLILFNYALDYIRVKEQAWQRKAQRS